MCGEIEDWQTAHGVSVRLTGTGARTNVILNQQYDDVEQINLDEIMITGFNAGVSAGMYVRIYQNGLDTSASNNESNPGVLVPVDVLNPNKVYNRPRVLAQGQMVNVSQFAIALFMPDGTPATFNEACIIMTFVRRRTADSSAEVRRLKATVDYLPSIVGASNTYQP